MGMLELAEKVSSTNPVDVLQAGNTVQEALDNLSITATVKLDVFEYLFSLLLTVVLLDFFPGLVAAGITSEQRDQHVVSEAPGAQNRPFCFIATSREVQDLL